MKVGHCLRCPPPSSQIANYCFSRHRRGGASNWTYSKVTSIDSLDELVVSASSTRWRCKIIGDNMLHHSYNVLSVSINLLPGCLHVLKLFYIILLSIFNLIIIAFIFHHHCISCPSYCFTISIYLFILLCHCSS